MGRIILIVKEACKRLGRWNIVNDRWKVWLTIVIGVYCQPLQMVASVESVTIAA